MIGKRCVSQNQHIPTATNTDRAHDTRTSHIRPSPAKPNTSPRPSPTASAKAKEEMQFAKPQHSRHAQEIPISPNPNIPTPSGVAVSVCSHYKSYVKHRTAPNPSFDITYQPAHFRAAHRSRRRQPPKPRPPRTIAPKPPDSPIPRQQGIKVWQPRFFAALSPYPKPPPANPPTHAR